MIPRGGGGGGGGHHGGHGAAGGGLLFSRRALQIYLFLFVNTLIFVMRSQWIVSMPSSLDTSVLSRHDADHGKADLGALQEDYERSQRDGANARIHDSLRKETRRGLDRGMGHGQERPHEVEVGAHGGQHRSADPYATFLPRDQDIIEDIYARGKARIREELKRRHHNYSAIEPFNPWGPVYIWDWFSPDYNCPTMERIGRVGDGGKWICGVDALTEANRGGRKCLVYSYGVNRDLSFELELIGRTGCEVHAFDPTVGGVPPDCKGNPHITFHKQALGPKSGPTDMFMLVETLLDTMKREGHTFIDVLKVDIEGSEWDTFKAMLPEKALPFGQLLIELHFRDVAEVFHFFDNVEGHGFRVFMRETNHNPCAAGKLPIAVEFSLINPGAYFKGLPDPAAVQSIAARPAPRAYKGVVYVLSHRGNLERLGKMLRSFDQNYNRRYKYPLVVFHEDFTAEDQQQLRAAAPHTAIDFRTVAFEVPAWLDKERIPERTPCSYHSSTVGYRHMNRFLAYFAAAGLAKEGYEWQWRLDDDSLITEEVGYDVFRLMAENGKRYGFTNIVQDDAKCVVGLWNATRDYVDAHGLETSFFTRWTEGAVFYNNFEVSHASIWTSPEYKAFFDHIDRLGGIYYHRWGDAPIRSIGVSLFVNESEVHQFTDIAYTHLPFIQRNASGLPSPSHTLFSRAGGSFAGNCSAAHDGHGGGHGGSNGTSCFSGRPSGVVYTVLNDAPGEEEKLMATLASLDAHFNDAHRYPVVVFGADLTYDRRRRIRAATRSVLEFHDLGFLAEQPLPAWVDRSRVPAYVDCAFGDDSVVDRKRNRYMAFEGVGKLAAQYDYLWRLVPGAVLTENVTADPFATLAASGKAYGYLMTVTDDRRCIKGLREATLRYARKAGVEPTFLHVLPEDAVFYDGFEVSRASLWTSPEYKAFFDYLDREGGMLYHRWTERNVITQALTLFTPPEQLHRFTDVGFEHAPFVKQTANRGGAKRPLDRAWRDRAIESVKPAPELDALLAPRRFGYLGADVATSFRLPSCAGYGAYAWLLGDTYLGATEPEGHGRRAGGALTVNNALAFMPSPAGEDALGPTDVSFFWRQGEDGVPAPAFEAPEGRAPGTVLWPVSGLSVEYEATAKLVLFAQRVLKKHNLTELLVGDGLSFEVEGTSVIFVDNPQATPSRWKYRAVDLPGTDARHNWFAAAALADGKEVATSPDDLVYLVGNVGTRGMGVYDEESRNVLGRIRVADLLLQQFDRLEVLAEAGGWARGVAPQQRKALFRPASAETSLQFHPALGAWTALEVDAVTAQLVLWTAPRPEGPWQATVLHSIEAPYDDLSKYRCYAGKGHPELAGELAPGQGVELVFSYVCNSPSDSAYLFDEGQLGLYAPRFVRVRLAPPVDGRPA